MHNSFQNGIQIQKLRRFKLQKHIENFFLNSNLNLSSPLYESITNLAPLPFHFLNKFSFSMRHQVVFHTGHKLSHVSHHNQRLHFFRFGGTGDEVIDTLSEYGFFIGGQPQSVVTNRSTGSGTGDASLG